MLTIFEEAILNHVHMLGCGMFAEANNSLCFLLSGERKLMGNSEAATPSKPEKLSSAVQGQPALHPYPDWAATMQAYSGPGLVPPPCFSTSVVPGYAPHSYIWPARFGYPYPVMYPNGVYPHPSLSLGTHALYPGLAQSPAATEAVEMATSLNPEVLHKKSRSKDKGLNTKRKWFDRSDARMANGNSDSLTGAYRNELAQSGYNSADGSSNRSGGSDPSGSDSQRNIGSEDMRSSGRFLRHISSPCPAAVPISMVPGCNGVSSEVRTQDERALKREKRKQSNRESARRSRLRKQAENDELAKKVDSMNAENLNIKSEISRLTKLTDALRAENSALLDKLKNSKSIQVKVEESSPDKMVSESTASIVAANLLSMINKPRLIDPCEEKHDASCDDSNGKLHQILDPPRTDVVAAN